MKKILNYVIIFLITLCSMMICLCIIVKHKNKMERNGEMEVEGIMVDGMVASYEYIDRDIRIDYFYNLSSDTTYNEIVNTIGKPNGKVGSGLVKPYYQVGDQYVVMWFSYNEAGEYDKILCMSLHTRDMFVEEIPLKSK